MIGVWLENQGLNIRCVEPPSLGNGKGDYLVEINGNFVFVEIKTLFGEKETLVQEEMLRDIVKLCRDKQFPVEDVHLFQYPSCYDYKNEKETLLQDVEGFIRNLLPVSHRYIINFNNKSGIWMRIRIAPDIVLPTSFGVSRVAQIQDYLSERLDEDDVQVSKENIPSICVINNCDPNIQRLGIERFLYGTTCDDYTKSEKPIFRQNDGRWSGDLKSELNAMVILSFESNSVKIKTSDAIYVLIPNILCQIQSSPIIQLIGGNLIPTVYQSYHHKHNLCVQVNFPKIDTGKSHEKQFPETFYE